MKVLVNPNSTSNRAGYYVMFISPYDDENHDYSKALCKDIYKNFFVLPMQDIIFVSKTN